MAKRHPFKQLGQRAASSLAALIAITTIFGAKALEYEQIVATSAPELSSERLDGLRH